MGSRVFFLAISFSFTGVSIGGFRGRGRGYLRRGSRTVVRVSKFSVSCVFRSIGGVFGCIDLDCCEVIGVV